MDLQQEKEHKVVRTSLLKPKLPLQHHRGKAGTDGGTVNLPSHLIIQSTQKLSRGTKYDQFKGTPGPV